MLKIKIYLFLLLKIKKNERTKKNSLICYNILYLKVSSTTLLSLSYIFEDIIEIFTTA